MEVPAWATGPLPVRTKGYVPSLPVEVYHAFIQFSSLEELPSLSLVNRTFHHEAQRLLFRDIDITSLRRLVLLLRILAVKPVIAGLVHTLIIAPPRRLIQPLGAFYGLLARALHQMCNLKHLELLLFGPYSRVLIGCPFRVTKLGIGADWDADLSKWFAEQSELRNLVFYGANCDPQTLSNDALSNLQSFSGPANALIHVTPGRPLDDIRVSLPDPSDLQAYTLGQIAEAAASSSAVITSFSIQTRSTERPGPAFAFDTPSTADALQPIATTLPSITSFAMMVHHSYVNRAMLDGIGEFIQQLPKLTQLMVLSRDEHDCIHDILVIRAVLEEWGKQSKTLQIVQFPDRLFVKTEHLGWMDSDSENLTLEQYIVLIPIVQSYVESQLDKW